MAENKPEKDKLMGVNSPDFSCCFDDNKTYVDTEQQKCTKDDFFEKKRAIKFTQAHYTDDNFYYKVIRRRKIQQQNFILLQPNDNQML